MSTSHSSRNAEIRARHATGETLASLARAYGISRQRADQIVNAKKAHARARAANLPRPSACSSCGAHTKIEAHHPDYGAPLDVRWLCRTCHQKAHFPPRPPRVPRVRPRSMDVRINVRLTHDDLAKIRAFKKRGESDADYIRAALREKMLRDARER